MYQAFHIIFQDLYEHPERGDAGDNTCKLLPDLVLHELCPQERQ